MKDKLITCIAALTYPFSIFGPIGSIVEVVCLTVILPAFAWLHRETVILMHWYEIAGFAIGGLCIAFMCLFLVWLGLITFQK